MIAGCNVRGRTPRREVGQLDPITRMVQIRSVGRSSSGDPYHAELAFVCPRGSWTNACLI